jgi:hypothetical protein
MRRGFSFLSVPQGNLFQSIPTGVSPIGLAVGKGNEPQTAIDFFADGTW